MNEKNYKVPRLFVTTNLNEKDVITLDESQAHYLNNVMRRKNGDNVRVFNGRDGEWLGTLQNAAKKKADLVLDECLIEQTAPAFKRHLYFAPIKKSNMEWMIEKAIELGVSDLHPVLTQNTQNRKLNVERINQQIIEASEQCERLTIPTLRNIVKIEALKTDKMQFLACLERKNGELLANMDRNQDLSIIIGPEGGFTEQEKAYLLKNCNNISLGNNILRAETAAIKALSILCD